jgi:hypothetical protein
LVQRHQFDSAIRNDAQPDLGMVRRVPDIRFALLIHHFGPVRRHFRCKCRIALGGQAQRLGAGAGRERHRDGDDECKIAA